MIVSRLVSSFALTVAFATGVVACSGGSTPGSANCGGLYQYGPTIVAPANGATAVPTAAAAIQFANTLPADPIQVFLVPNPGGTPLVLGVVHGTGQATGPLVSVPYPQLATSTTYQLNYKDVSTTNPCASVPFYPNNGSFTTQ